MKKLLSALFLMTLLVSCGEEADQNTEDNFYTQYQSGSCGLDVVSDYNSAIGHCGYGDTVSECVSYLEQFKSKYPGINCTAERGYGLDEEIFTITESYIDSLIEQDQYLN